MSPDLAGYDSQWGGRGPTEFDHGFARFGIGPLRFECGPAWLGHGRGTFEHEAVQFECKAGLSRCQPLRFGHGSVWFVCEACRAESGPAWCTYGSRLAPVGLYTGPSGSIMVWPRPFASRSFSKNTRFGSDMNRPGPARLLCGSARFSQDPFRFAGGVLSFVHGPVRFGCGPARSETGSARVRPEADQIAKGRSPDPKGEQRNGTPTLTKPWRSRLVGFGRLRRMVWWLLGLLCCASLLWRPAEEHREAGRRPTRAEPEANRAEPDPSRTRTGPHRAEPEPNRTEPSPSRTRTEPNRARTEQNRAELKPSRAEPSPSRNRTEPNRPEPDPNRTKPNQTQSEVRKQELIATAPINFYLKVRPGLSPGNVYVLKSSKGEE